MERFEQLAALLASRCPALELRADEPMSKYTTFRIGGPAALMALPRTVGEAKAAVKTARELGIEPFFLGNGSNLLVADEGYPGFIVKLSWDFDEIREVNRGLEAGGAVLLSRLSNALVDRGLTGLEFASGIPGSVGGAVVMNAGAYDSEMKNVLTACRHINADGSEGVCAGEELDLSYRHSVYSGSDKIITELRLRLQPGDPEAIRAKMDDLMNRRKSKQPLEFPSAGSVFKRPAGHFAGTLIEQCGLKGYRIGGAEVSEKHAGFIVNRGDATCSDVRRLIEHIQKEVFLQTSIELQTEIKVVGITQNG